MGAITVTFLPCSDTLVDVRNGVQVMLENQPMTSDSSLSGFRFSFRIALPDGSFLHELNSFSPGSSAPVSIGAAPGAGGAMVRPIAGGTRGATFLPAGFTAGGLGAFLVSPGTAGNFGGWAKA